MDAVTYLWAELGTSCAHLGETHALVQLFRAILNVLESGDPRSINRKNIDEETLLLKLGDRTSSSHKVATGFSNLIDKRSENLAFHPNGSQKILQGNPAVFSLVRVSPDHRHRVVALVNVSARRQQVRFPAPEIGLGSSSWIDILTDERFPSSDGGIATTLEPFQIRWFSPE